MISYDETLIGYEMCKLCSVHRFNLQYWAPNHLSSLFIVSYSTTIKPQGLY